MSQEPLIPPPVAEPIPHVPPRNLGGWLIVSICFLLLISFQTTAAFKRPSDDERSFSPQSSELRVLVMQREMMERFKVSQLPTSDTQALDQIIAQVQPLADKNQNAAQLLAAATFVKDGEAAQASLEALRKGDEKAKAIAEAFAAEVDDPAAARRLAQRVQGTVAGDIAAKKVLRESGADPMATSQPAWALLAFPLLILVGMGVFCLGFVILVVYIFKRRAGGFVPVGYPVPALTLPDSDRYAWRMALYLGAYIVVPSVIAGFIPGLSDTGRGLIAMIAMLAAVVTILSVRFGGVSDLRRILGVTERWPRLVGIGLLGVCANAVVLIVVTLSALSLSRFLPEPEHPVTNELAQATTPVQVLLLFVIAAVLAPLIEELTFRGLLAPSLGRLINRPYLGMALAAFLFAMVHPQGPALWPSLAVLGFTMSFLAYQTGSLIPSIVLHGVHNGATLVAGLILS